MSADHLAPRSPLLFSDIQTTGPLLSTSGEVLNNHQCSSGPTCEDGRRPEWLSYLPGIPQRVSGESGTSYFHPALPPAELCHTGRWGHLAGVNPLLAQGTVIPQPTGEAGVSHHSFFRFCTWYSGILSRSRAGAEDPGREAEVLPCSF